MVGGGGEAAFSLLESGLGSESEGRVFIMVCLQFFDLEVPVKRTDYCSHAACGCARTELGFLSMSSNVSLFTAPRWRKAKVGG